MPDRLARLIMVTLSNITVTKDIEVSDRDIWSALVGAFEGGSNYWYWAEPILPEGMTSSRMKPEWNSLVKAENDKRLRAMKHADSGNLNFLPFRERAEEDFGFLKQHNVYVYIHQIPFLGGSLRITQDSADGKELGILDYAAIERGMQLFAEEGGSHWDDFYGKNGDAITYDVMLQLMVMGKVVYG